MPRGSTRRRPSPSRSGPSSTRGPAPRPNRGRLPDWLLSDCVSAPGSLSGSLVAVCRLVHVGHSSRFSCLLAGWSPPSRFVSLLAWMGLLSRVPGSRRSLAFPCPATLGLAFLPSSGSLFAEALRAHACAAFDLGSFLGISGPGLDGPSSSSDHPFVVGSPGSADPGHWLGGFPRRRRRTLPDGACRRRPVSPPVLGRRRLRKLPTLPFDLCRPLPRGAAPCAVASLRVLRGSPGSRCWWSAAWAGSLLGLSFALGGGGWGALRRAAGSFDWGAPAPCCGVLGPSGPGTRGPKSGSRGHVATWAWGHVTT